MSIGNGLDIEYRILSSIQLLAHRQSAFTVSLLSSFDFLASCPTIIESDIVPWPRFRLVTIDEERGDMNSSSRSDLPRRDRSGFLFRWHDVIPRPIGARKNKRSKVRRGLRTLC